MHVLIVESRSDLSMLWKRHMERQGHTVALAATQDEATEYLDAHAADIIVLDLVIAEGSALAIADYAEFRQPKARVIFVTSTTFFSDGSIFAHSANARAFVAADTPAEDLTAMVEHYGERP